MTRETTLISNPDQQQFYELSTVVDERSVAVQLLEGVVDLALTTGGSVTTQQSSFEWCEEWGDAHDNLPVNNGVATGDQFKVSFLIKESELYEILNFIESHHPDLVALIVCRVVHVNASFAEWYGRTLEELRAQRATKRDVA